MAQNRYTALIYQSIVLKYSSSNIPYYFSTLSTLNINFGYVTLSLTNTFLNSVNKG